MEKNEKPVLFVMQETLKTAQGCGYSASLSRQKSPKPSTASVAVRKASSLAQSPALFVSISKTVFMQRLVDMIIAGHHHYIFGKVEFDKAFILASKFDTLYKTGLSRMEQSRRRGRGEAAFRWQSWYDEKSGIVHWVLMKSPGQIPLEAGREKWMDATTRNRLTAPGGYELVRITKPNEPRPVWTWRYSKTHYEGLRESILGDIRAKRDVQLSKLILQIWRTPGFSGARGQVKQIKILIREEWKRRRGSDQLPDIPDKIGYVRRLASKGQVLKKPVVSQFENLKS